MALWDNLIKRVINPIIKDTVKKSVNETVDTKLIEKKEDIEKGVFTQAMSYNYNPISYNGSIARNFTHGVRFQTLRDFSNYYPILRSCVNYRKRQITQLNWDITPKEVAKTDQEKETHKEQIMMLKKFFKYPTGDKSSGFRDFINTILEDLMVLDAAAIYRRKNKKGGLYAYQPIDASTIKLVLYEDGSLPQPPDYAYIQEIRGQEVAKLTIDELIYRKMNSRSYTPYGLSPVEALIIVVTTALKLSAYNLSYLCYDDKTEILTKNGWKFFKDLDDNDFIATRSPNEIFEWQKPLKRVVFDYDDNLIQFKSKTVDLLVTPNHRMLVDYRNSEGEFKKEKKGIIKEAEWFLKEKKSMTQNYLAPTNSIWKGDSPKYFELPGYMVERIGVFSGYAFKGRDKNGKPIRSKEKFTTEEKIITYEKPAINIPIKDWLSFFGIFIAEGWVRAENTDSKHDVCISQSENSNKLLDIKKLLTKLPFDFRREGKDKYVCSDVRLWQYLIQFGKSYEKYIPNDIKNYSSDLLKILWEWMCKGDGTKQDKWITYTTVSKKLADDCQEILQKIGFDSRIYIAINKVGNTIKGKNKPIQSVRTIYKIIQRLSEHRNLDCAKEEKYTGKVYSVKVPNGIVYVRRNGYPSWCGNTEGNVPEGFVELPKDIASDPDQLKQWQNAWDAMFAGDPRFQRKIKFLPEGMKWTATKKTEDLQFERFEKWLLQETCSLLEVAPQSIGFQFERGKGATEAEWQIGKEKGLYPLANFLKEIFDMIIQEEFGYNHLEFVWTDINPTNKIEEARVFDILSRSGAISVDEWRIGEGMEPIGCPPYIMTPVGPIFVKDLIKQSESGVVLTPYRPGSQQQTQTPVVTNPILSKKPAGGIPTKEPPKTEIKPEVKPPESKKVTTTNRVETVEELKRWKKVAINDLKSIRGFRDFKTTIIDQRTQDLIKSALQTAKSKDDLDDLFDPFIGQENQIISALMDLYEEVNSIANETSKS